MAEGDAEILAAVRHGDVDRFAELVDRYQGPAIRLAFSLLGNYEDARDASQEAFVNAYRSLDCFHGGAKFSTWLYRIVVNECKDVYKRRARQPAVAGRIGPAEPDEPESLFVDVEDPGESPRARLANREVAQQMTAALRTLPLRQRTAFLLHHVHGLALQETAETMGCRIGTVKAHIFRATESLRKRLTPWITQEIR